MRTIKRTAQFRRDLKRYRNNSKIREEIQATVLMLARDEQLPEKLLDHPLSGNLGDIRECHVKPDTLLLYRKETLDGEAILELVRIGSHAEIF